jgi:hypothetical protein
VHCLSGPGSLGAKAQPAHTRAEAEAIRAAWLRQGAARVAIREVDNSRDWNNTADPEVQRAMRDERDTSRG